MKIPCEGCIVFALCKQKNPLRCKLLYDYVYADWTIMTHKQHESRMKEIGKMFDKRGYYHYGSYDGDELSIEWAEIS